MTTATYTPEQIKAAARLTLATADAIREAGRVPEGVLYATMMDVLSPAQFQEMLGVILDSGMVRREGHELIWIG